MELDVLITAITSLHLSPGAKVAHRACDNSHTRAKKCHGLLSSRTRHFYHLRFLTNLVFLALVKAISLAGSWVETEAWDEFEAEFWVEVWV